MDAGAHRQGFGPAVGSAWPEASGVSGMLHGLRSACTDLIAGVGRNASCALLQERPGEKESVQKKNPRNKPQHKSNQE